MYRRKHIHYILLAISVFVFFFIYFYGNYKTKSMEKNIYSLREDNRSNSERLFAAEKNLEKEESLLEKNKNIHKLLENIESESFSLKNINTFVSSFEIIAKGHYGIKKIDYEIHRQDKKMSINIDYLGDYNDIRNFIYELEKEFYFLEINYFRVEKEEEAIRANLNIQVYFRGEDNK